jgi:TonB family protein
VRLGPLLFTLPLVLLAEAVPADVQAFIPNLLAVKRTEAVYPPQARDQKIQGAVEVLVTIDPAGTVVFADVLSGPPILRQAAVDAVKQWQFNSIIRDGHPVTAMTCEMVAFWMPGNMIRPEDYGDMSERTSATQRVSELTKQFPRSPGQVLADLENSLVGASAREREFWSGSLAKDAFRAGDLNKAAVYAYESLQSPAAAQNGGLMHDGNMVLGLLALKQGGVSDAKQYLLKAGATKGGPALNSFGPNMMLAQALLEAGEREAVLQYFDACRAFWKMGAKKLDDWSAMVRGGGNPNFGANLLY